MAASPITPSSSRPSKRDILDAPVSTVWRVGKDGAKLLGRIGITTVRQLLWHLPRRYEDLSKVRPLRSLVEGEKQTAIARLGRISQRRTARGRILTEAELLDDDGRPSRVRASWFGRSFVRQNYREGQEVRLSGLVKFLGRGLAFSQPTLEPAEREAVHTGRIVPVYRLGGDLKAGVLRRWLHTAVEGARDPAGKQVREPLLRYVSDPLPDAVRERHALPSLVDALKQVHFPDDPLALFRARRRLAFDELLVLQLATAQRRARWAAEATSPALEVSDADLDAWIADLPFALTGAQQRALAQIRADLSRSVPMSRLLEGDVGSGKTVVAALAMRIAHRRGAQAALMAPTELLVEQHFRTLRSMFDGGGPRVELLTAGSSGAERQRVLAGLSDGQVDVVVGTHALIEEGIAFRRLALAVVDEQHRFGVRQRSLLREKGVYPHVLMTTATPIPQTLAQTLFRDLDLSVLDEMPAGRLEIKTEVRPPSSLPKLWEWVRARVGLGEQAFVVCPRIDPADETEDDGTLFGKDAFAPSAVGTFGELREGALKGLRVGLAHGRMPQRERDQVMAKLRDRQLDVLVATSVIEVGIDIPAATVMVVLGAERFGLAQLHQLRGRVGRRERQSFCVLVSPASDSDRLRAMSARRGDGRLLNGFELAQKDLEIRGPGQFLGQEQSGFAEQLRVVDLMDIDPRLLDDVRVEVDRILATDAGLDRPEHAALRDAVDELWRRYGYA